MNGSRKNYSTYDIEFYAGVQALKHWRPYLINNEFVLYSDHAALKHINNQDKLSNRHAPWASYLQQFTFNLHHKSGVLNKAADALSRRASILTVMRSNVMGFESFRELYSDDVYFVNVVADINAGKMTTFHMHDGFIFKGNQLCIPQSSLRQKIIQELHNEGHVGRDKTLLLVQQSYFWPTQRKEVYHFVERCRICQVSKGTATNAGL